MTLDKVGSADLTPEEIAKKRGRCRDLVARILDDSTDQATKKILQKEFNALRKELPETERLAAETEATDALPPTTRGFEPSVRK